MIDQAALLVCARSLGFLFKAPGFSHPSVPPPVRAGLAIVLGLGLAPARPRAAHLDAVQLFCAGAVEISVGAAMGYGAAVLYEGAYAGGRLLDDYVGIRGSVPTAAIAGSTGLGRLWSSAFVAAFFLANGHLVALDALAASFERLPPGAALGDGALLGFASALPAAIVRAALAVAGPAIVLVVAIQLALASVSRVVPRFGNFALPFPIVFAAVILVTLGAIPAVLPLAGDPLRFALFPR